MSRKRQPLSREELLAAERGAVHKQAPETVALVYPSPYRAAMSSLGYQTIYRRINDMPGFAAHRATLPDPGDPFVTFESNRPVGDFPLLAFSVAYELEIAGLIECLERAGIEPLAAERGDRDPLIIAGGPLTFSNPIPLAPFCDAVVMGEAEELIGPLLEAAAAAGYDRETLLDSIDGMTGIWIPSRHGERLIGVAAASPASLPARSQVLTPHTELADMFLTEAVRGCSRGCTYCVMRRSTNGGMRLIDPDEILGAIPEDATRVGLVGASVTDHPRIAEIVRGVVDAGRGVGISSLRAGKLTDELVGLLAAGGYRTLTVASDGASARLRDSIERSTTEQSLLRSAELAKKHRLRVLKVYMMVGLPGETDDDIDELVRFTLELAAVHRTALGIAPFVAKRNTPLDGEPFAGIAAVDARLKRLRAGLAGRAEVRPTSARWAWVEYMLAQGGASAGLAVLDAHRAGASFAAYKKAFAARGVEPTGPVARVPSSSEIVALKRSALQARRAGRA
jgi:radical SAM superfamily enzyme YgiQ (UPF0313 family)